MFRSFGHENSSIIDGGLPRWVDEGHPLDTAAPTLPKPGTYGLPKFKEGAIKSIFLSSFYHDLSLT
jgi:thiosulfate/3-mercaptopyruvate sulfurtransferase